MVRVVAALAERRSYAGPGEPDAGQERREVFLARRAAGLNHGGLWELPGGKVEEGESPEAAIHRELDEELGIGVELLGSARHYEAIVEGRPFLFLVFPSRFLSEPLRLAAHDAWRWFSVPSLHGLALAPLDVPVLEDWADGDKGEDRGGSGDDD